MSSSAAAAIHRRDVAGRQRQNRSPAPQPAAGHWLGCRSVQRVFLRSTNCGSFGCGEAHRQHRAGRRPLLGLSSPESPCARACSLLPGRYSGTCHSKEHHRSRELFHGCRPDHVPVVGLDRVDTRSCGGRAGRYVNSFRRKHLQTVRTQRQRGEKTNRCAGLLASSAHRHAVRFSERFRPKSHR